MNQHSFEARVLDVWMRTRIPLTRANLMAVTRAPRKKLERWLEEMVREGVLEMDADDDGEMIWTVRGAVRGAGGPTSVAELDKLDGLRRDLGHAGTALALAGRSVGLTSRRRPGGPVADEKSLVASGAASLILGPVGWLYAAPLREAIPAIVVFGLMWRFMFSLPLIGWPIMILTYVASGLAGVAYAWRYNQHGERTPLADSSPSLPPRR